MTNNYSTHDSMIDIEEVEQKETSGNIGVRSR